MSNRDKVAFIDVEALRVVLLHTSFIDPNQHGKYTATFGIPKTGNLVDAANRDAYNRAYGSLIDAHGRAYSEAGYKEGPNDKHFLKDGDDYYDKDAGFADIVAGYYHFTISWRADLIAAGTKKPISDFFFQLSEQPDATGSKQVVRLTPNEAKGGNIFLMNATLWRYNNGNIGVMVTPKALLRVDRGAEIDYRVNSIQGLAESVGASVGNLPPAHVPASQVVDTPASVGDVLPSYTAAQPNQVQMPAMPAMPAAPQTQMPAMPAAPTAMPAAPTAMPAAPTGLPKTL